VDLVEQPGFQALLDRLGAMHSHGLRAGSRFRLCQLACSFGGERALKIEKQVPQLLDVEVDELREYLAGNVRTSSTRRTGFRFVRGTHGGHYVRDREETDIGPAGMPVR